ncbi:uncharacterized protein LOC107813195 isoform X2 [Nicotiana tabacum]|uniref:uncharacterized protein LOC107813195 isoform X2 n=1 Tax=Nicotiana tabacum TaxID=4097 RepID=UPI003F4EC709
MASFSTSCCFAKPSITPNIPLISHGNTRTDYYKGNNPLRRQRFITSASKSGGFSLKSGTGKNKKNGNIFERWKCFDCQGFGMKSCPVCGKV